MCQKPLVLMPDDDDDNNNMEASCVAASDVDASEVDASDADTSNMDTSGSGSGSDTEENTKCADDLMLPCGCHMHWECLFDEATDVAISLKCPACEKYLPNNPPGPSVTNAVFQAPQGVSILCRYKSEGGVQNEYDILPDLTEEAYLQSHPEGVEGRAFMTHIRNNDILGMMDMLVQAPIFPGIDDTTLDVSALMRWQNPLDNNKSTLMVAVEENQIDPFYLLLWTASRAPEEAFPRRLLTSVQQSGIARPPCGPVDIRSIQDANGDTAKDYAQRMGGEWQFLVDVGMFEHA
jgi:hypothetical protein